MHWVWDPKYSICGKPYPWTASEIEAAEELINSFDELHDDEKTSLITSIPNIMNDNVKTNIAAARFKKVMGKLSKSALGSLREILVDIASDAVKKSLGL